MNDTKKRSIKQEKRVAKEIKGRTVVASGALWGSKGDARSSQFLVECKTTHSDKYLLNYYTWVKISSEAIKDGFREPVMCIDLEDGKNRLAVLDYKVYADLAKALCAEISPEFEMEEINTIKSNRLLRYSSEPRKLVFLNKQLLHTVKDIELLIIPWGSFCDYLDRIDKECE